MDKNRTPVKIHWIVSTACLCHREMLTSERDVNIQVVAQVKNNFPACFLSLLIIWITGLHILTWDTLLFGIVLRHSFKWFLTAPSSRSAPNASQLKKLPAWPMRCMVTAQKYLSLNNTHTQRLYVKTFTEGFYQKVFIITLNLCKNC